MTTTTTRPLQAGETAPDFTAGTTSGSNVTLSSFKGQKNVLLAFFPMAFTSTCTAELCSFSENFDAYSAKDVEVLPISVDMVPSLKEFRAKYDMKVHLVSDLRRDISRAYGVLREASYFSERAYFLIDKAGVIRWSYVESALGEKRETEELLAAIASISG